MILEKINTENKEYIIEIGQDKFDNDLILRKSKQNDLWFHLDKFNSPFIILHNNGDKIDKKYLYEIGNMFKKYKSHIPDNYKVVYTNVKNINRTCTPGTVIFKKTPSIIII
jgi:predicted ribosome quality control (RQC) complex YloA/Tae2 family protein